MGSPPAPGMFQTMRERFVGAAAALPQPARALLPGMVFGDRSGMDEALGEAMKVASLSHLSAVSGDTAGNKYGYKEWSKLDQFLWAISQLDPSNESLRVWMILVPDQSIGCHIRTCRTVPVGE